jgi:hypothetical protein
MSPRRALPIGDVAPGLRALEAMVIAGCSDVQPAIEVLRRHAARASRPVANERMAKVHLESSRNGRDVGTYCGKSGGIAWEGSGTYECDTAECDRFEGTAKRELVTCLRCLRIAQTSP